MTTDEDRTKEQQAILDQARERVSRLAIGMCKIIPAMDVASVLLGAGITVLQHSDGRDVTVKYLRLLAEELEQDTGRTHGHA